MVLVLYGFGFLAVGSEWFLMWQSATWNGAEAAARYFLVAGVVLLVLLAGGEDAAARSAAGTGGEAGLSGARAAR